MATRHPKQYDTLVPGDGCITDLKGGGEKYTNLLNFPNYRLFDIENHPE